MYSQQFNNRFFRLRRFCLPTLLAALLVVTTVSCRKESPQSKSAASSTASLVSDEALFHVEVSDLGKIVLGLAKSVQEIAATVPESQQNFRVVKDFIEKKLGINPLSLAEYEKIGIDLTKPVGLSVLPNHNIDGLFDEVHGVIHVAVTDPGKVIDLLKRLLVDVNASINKLEGNGGMFYTVKEHGNDVMGLAFHRGYVSIIFADVRDDDALENYLPRYMAAVKKKPLQENKQYQRTSENFTPDSLARLFVNLQVAVNMFEEEESVSIPLFQEFLAVGASVGAQEVRTSLQMTADSGLLKLIKPGDSCQDLLANAETPMAAFSMSLADPLAVVEYVIRHMEEEREQGNAKVKDFKRDIQRLPEELAVSYQQVVKSVAPLSAAVLIYPEFVDLGQLFGVPLRVPEVVGLLKMQEQGLASRLLTFAFQEGERETHGQSTLYVIPGVVAGSVDGHLVAGTAMDRIRTIASEEAESWKPFVGDSQLFAAEVDMLAVQQAVIAQQEMPRVVELSINALMKKMLKSKSPLKVKTERLKDGVMTSVDLGSFQVDRHILKLYSEPIHMILEEMSEEIGRLPTGTSKEKSAKIQLQAMDKALELYEIDMSRYPDSRIGLSALQEPPRGDSFDWNGPYLKKIIPKDPWGQDYLYELRSSDTGRQQYKIWSAGPNMRNEDGRDGTDDIVVDSEPYEVLDSEPYEVLDSESVEEEGMPWIATGIIKPQAEPADTKKIQPNAKVIGIVVESKARAYLLAAFDNVERTVVNDVIDGTPVSITYYPMKSLDNEPEKRVRVFIDEYDNKALVMGLAGTKNGQMRIYCQSKKYFQMGSKIPVWHDANQDGKQDEGEVHYLADLEFKVMNWGDWKKAYPATDVYLGKGNKGEIPPGL